MKASMSMFLALGLLSGLVTRSLSGNELDDTERIDSRSFMIPIYYKRDIRDQVDRLRILVSLDKGKTWKVAGELPVDQTVFAYTAPKDGLYWFAIQYVLKNKTTDPPDLSKMAPALKVSVDRGKPGGPTFLVEAIERPSFGGAETQALKEEVRSLRKKVANLEQRLTELD